MMQRFQSRHMLVVMVAGALVAATMTQCASNGCLDNRNSIPLAGFYDSETGEAVAVTGLTVGGVGAPGDSLILANGSASQVYLPFRASVGEVTYVFSVGDENVTYSDSVRFVYNSTPYFVDTECGAMFRYRIREVSFDGTLIDSIAVTDSLITNVESERIKIYFYGSPQ